MHPTRCPYRFLEFVAAQHRERLRVITGKPDLPLSCEMAQRTLGHLLEGGCVVITRRQPSGWNVAYR